jgi:hypothetical protein
MAFTAYEKMADGSITYYDSEDNVGAVTAATFQVPRELGTVVVVDVCVIVQNIATLATDHEFYGCRMRVLDEGSNQLSPYWSTSRGVNFASQGVICNFHGRIPMRSREKLYIEVPEYDTNGTPTGDVKWWVRLYASGKEDKVPVVPESTGWVAGKSLSV